MPWQKKSSAPATINVGDAFAALITGDATWGWLVNWIPLLPPETIQTADLCALGPSTTPGLSLADFVAPMGMDAAQIMAHQIELAGKLRTTMYDRLFGAYCELPGPPVQGCVVVDVAIPYVAGGGNNYIGAFPAPAGASTVDWYLDSRTTGDTTVQINFQPAIANAGQIDRYMFEAYFSPNGQHIDQKAWQSNWDSFVLFSDRRMGATLHVEFCGPQLGSGTTNHTPTAQPQPVGVIPPPTRTYPDIAALGAELDRQELKLEVILSTLQTMATRTVVGPTAIDTPVDAATGPVIAPAAIGFRIDVSSIPPGTDEAFGTPPRYHRLGRVTLGSANGWLPALDLQQNPQIVAPLPPGIDRIQVVCHPPATATITPLLPPK